MVTAKNLHLTRGKFSLAIDGLALPDGKCVGLVGPNGAGKTTLLDILGGRLRCPGGIVEFESVPASEFGAMRGLIIGVMPDRLYGLQSHTVREHFALRARCFPGWCDEYLEQLVSALDIPLDIPLAALSKGTQAKVAFASVEAYRPPVLLLDEPTSGLDPIVRRELRGALTRALKESPARSVLFSTHLVEDLLDVADSVLLIRHGRVLSELELPDGTAKEERGRLLESALDLLEQRDPAL